MANPNQPNQNPNQDNPRPGQQQQQPGQGGQGGGQQGGGGQRPGQQGQQQPGSSGSQGAARSGSLTSPTILEVLRARPRQPAGPLPFELMCTTRALRRSDRLQRAGAGLCLRHGHRHRAAAVSPLRRSAGRSGIRLHPHRNDLVALVDSRLDDPRASPSQSLPDPADRAGRRRDDVRSVGRAVRGAVRDPGAADHRARLSFPSAQSPTAG